MPEGSFEASNPSVLLIAMVSRTLRGSVTAHRFAFYAQLCKEILEELGDSRFDVEEISQAIPDEEKGPYQHVFLQVRLTCLYLGAMEQQWTRGSHEEVIFRAPILYFDAGVPVHECPTDGSGEVITRSRIRLQGRTDLFGVHGEACG